MSLQELDKAINDLMEKAELGEATDEEIRFLFNLHGDLGSLLQTLMFKK